MYFILALFRINCIMNANTKFILNANYELLTPKQTYNCNLVSFLVHLNNKTNLSLVITLHYMVCIIPSN